MDGVIEIKDFFINQIKEIEQQMKYVKPVHYKPYCVCEMCFNYKNLVLTKENFEKEINATYN